MVAAITVHAERCDVGYNLVRLLLTVAARSTIHSNTVLILVVADHASVAQVGALWRLGTAPKLPNRCTVITAVDFAVGKRRRMCMLEARCGVKRHHSNCA